MWHVEDKKISHVDPDVIDEVMSKIEAKLRKMSKTRGEKHGFLDININFNGKKVHISMKKHMLKAMEAYGENITRNASTPAKPCLFNIRESPKLPEAKADMFYSVTALLLFVSRRCRLDIQTAVGYLTTRVANPNEDNWLKLKRVL